MSNVVNLNGTEITPKQKRQREKHHRIMKAALKEFSLNGYSGASMQAIADRAQVSKPTLYHYVGQKDVIFNALLDQGKSTILAPLANTEGHNIVEVLWDFSWSYAQFVLDDENMSIARLVIAEAERVPELAKHYYSNGPEQALTGIAKYLDKQQESNLLAFDDSAIAADNLWSLVLSGPRNRAFYFPEEQASQKDIRKNIVIGLQVFLKAYAVDADDCIKTLSSLSKKNQ